jgi:hypothetical protein
VNRDDGADRSEAAGRVIEKDDCCDGGGRYHPNNDGNTNVRNTARTIETANFRGHVIIVWLFGERLLKAHHQLQKNADDLIDSLAGTTPDLSRGSSGGSRVVMRCTRRNWLSREHPNRRCDRQAKHQQPTINGKQIG